MSLTVSARYWRAESTAASITGAWIKKPYNRHVSAEFTWTSTTNGTIKMQHRSAGGTAVDTSDADAEFSSQPNGSNAGTIQCNWENVPGDEYRFVYTRTNGTGALTCNLAQGDSQE
jgi:hypothetical protein